MPDPKQILDGTITYTLEDFYKEIKDDWMKANFPNLANEKKWEIFKGLFMFLMLSGEDKPMRVMLEVYKWSEKQIEEMQKTWEAEIDVVRHIHMKKFLDLYKEYQGGESMTLKLLNLWIKDFLKKHIEKEGKNGSA